MITLTKGNFFDFEASIRINTVNCFGAMGAGVALQFKNMFPNMFNEYKRLCQNKEIKIGEIHIWKSDDIFSNLTIINFPTKDHWKDPSKYEYIEKGLNALNNYLKTIPNQTITLPALGCGHGGLDWEIVKPMIFEKLNSLHHNILLFEPESSQNVPFIDDNVLMKNNISVATPDSKIFPDNLKGKTSRSIFYSGNIELINSKIINIISSKKPTEKEKYTLYAIISELKSLDFNYSILLRGDKSYEIDIINFLLKEGINTIVNPSKGLVNFKIRNDLKSLITESNFLAYNSIQNQQENWSIANFTNNYKESFELTEITIFNISDQNELLKLLKNSNKSKRLFYINYFSNPIESIDNNYIHKIGKSIEGKPNVRKILFQ